MINPGTINFTLCNGLAIYKGADWVIPATLANRDVSEGSIVDTPIDLTGFTGRAAIKRHAGDDQAVALPRVTITDPVNGEFQLDLSGEETAAIITRGADWHEVTKLQYDVYLDEASTGASYRVLQGFVEISPNVLDNDDHE